MAGKKTDKAKKRVNFNAQSSDSEDEPSNIVLRSKIDKKLLNNSNKIQMNFSDSDSSDDDKTSTKKSNIITINPARQQRLDQKAKSTAFSKENQRMLKQLQEQVELEEKEDRRKARLARKHAKRKEAEKNGSKYESSEEEVSTEDDYSSEDDDGSLITADMDAKIYETLLSLKTKDPRIYDKDVVYFKKPVEGEEVETTTPRTKADKKLTLGKYLTQQAAKGEDIVSDSDEDEPDFETFQQEQDRIKSDFFKTLHEDEAKKNKAANDVSSDDSDDDDFFGASKKVWNPLDESDSDEEEAQKVKEATEFANSIDDSSKISDASFLSNYLEQGWWKEKDASKIPAAEALLGKTRSETLAATFDIENADNEEEANDQFEAEYNFRFMEEGADEVAAHPRSHMIDDSVRKKDTTRRDARLRKVERQNLEKAQRLEEIKRLKNVKRQLLKDRMNTIYTVAGLEKSEEMIDDDIEYDMQEEYADNSKKPSKDDKKNRLSAKDITDDFDPEEYDKMMEKMFGDDFYGDIDENNLEHEELLLDNKNAQAIIDEAINAVDDREDDEEDESVPAGLEIPADFDTDDSDLDDYEREDRRKSRNKFIMQHKVVTKSTNKSRFKEAGSIKRTVQDVLDTGNKREMEIWWKQHKKEILSKGDAHEKMRDMTRDEKEEAVKKYIQEEMNKIDELDKEDVLSGTRYKYRQVEAHDYGMDVLELFNTDDRELNRRVNLRRLAAYRKDEDRGRTWKDIQDDQRQVYKEYVKKTGKSRPYDKHGQKDISSKEKEAVESFDNRHKRWNLGMDLSQAHNRKGPKGVKSTDWYSSKNNFTIPSKLVNKRITFDGKSDVLEAFKKHKSK